jgi:hypothetical protein
MKALLILSILLTSVSTFAVTLETNAGGANEIMKDIDFDELNVMYMSTLNGALTSSTVASPIFGVLMFADGERTIINLDNEIALEEVDLIQVALEDGDELSDFQNAVLEIGMANGQLDEDANVLE